MNTKRRKQTKAVRDAKAFIVKAQERKSWIDPELALPDGVDAIEAGRTPRTHKTRLSATLAVLKQIKAKEHDATL